MFASDESRERATLPAFGHLLKRLRIAADLTQESLAERAGVSARLISDLERSIVLRPRRETVRMLADALRLPESERADFIALARGRQPDVAPAVPAEREPRRHALPIPPTPIIGRQRETAAATALLAAPGVRLLTLTGPGGVGKTRLAIEVASRAGRGIPDGGCFVDLTPLRDASMVLPAIAQALGVKAGAAHALGDRVRAWIADQRMLLVLDNCEHVVDAAPEIADLLAACEQLTILATSRALLRIRAEQEYRLEPLATPALDQRSSLDELAQNPSVQLFVRRAERANRGFALTERNAADVTEITVRLDGLPLAIELATAHLKLLSASGLLARLERRLPLLTGGARDLPARLQTMQATIDWSYDRLHADEQRLFRRLSVCAGGFSLEAAEWVMGDDPSPIDLVASLVDMSLLRARDDELDQTRFTMLETIREYGLERLAEAGEEVDTRQRQAAWCMDLAARAEPQLTGADQPRWLARLDGEHDNLRAALAWAIGHGDGETAARIGGAIWRFWEIRGHYDEGRRWLEQTLHMGGDISSGARAKACRGAATLTSRQGNQVRAIAWNEEALRLFRAQGDQAGIASALGSMALAVHEQGDLARAAALYQETLALYRRIKDRVGLVRTLINLGCLAYDRGDYPRAIPRFDEALAISRELGNRNGIAHSIVNLAHNAHARGDDQLATTLFLEAAARFRELGNKVCLADCLEGFAQVAAADQEPERVARLLGAAEALRERIGAPPEAVHRREVERDTAGALKSLSALTLDEEWESGRAMSLEDAVEFALGGGQEVPADPTRLTPVEC